MTTKILIFFKKYTFELGFCRFVSANVRLKITVAFRNKFIKISL